MSVHHLPWANTDQDELVSALLDPRGYPHPVDHVRHIETHISHVFLAGRYAYKVKKPLALPFLDYSTLSKRKAACEEELRLNRRTAPELYLGMVPIGRTVAGLRLGAHDDIRDYAVKMVRFRDDQLCSDLLRRGALLPAHIDALARTLATFHGAIDRGGPECEHGLPARIHGWTTENFDALEAASPALRERLQALRAWLDRSFARLEPLMLARQRDGYIRECHGDLHLANVTLIDDRPVLFDCIEFNPALRWIDTMNETAFVFMDLLHGGRPDYAYRFLNTYLEETGDYAGVPLLHYYAAYRALVRAKVAALRARQSGGSDEPVREYATLAEQLNRPHRPWLLITHGLSGSGKSTIAQRLLETLPAIRVRSDVERKRIHGLSATAKSASALGAGLYATTATDQTFARLAELARIVLAAGESVIVDATFLRRAMRSVFRALAEERSVPFAIVACVAPRTVLEQRVGRRTGDASEADLEVLAHQFAQLEPVSAGEADQCYELETDAPPEALRVAIDRLGAQLRATRS